MRLARPVITCMAIVEDEALVTWPNSCTTQFDERSDGRISNIANSTA